MARQELAAGFGVDGAICRRCGNGGARRTPQRARWNAAFDRQAGSSRFVKHSPGFLKLVDDAKSRVREVSVDETRRKIDAGEAKVIDVREESEWAAGHIQGAEYLGRGILERDIESRVSDKNAELVLYCGGGFRSALATDNLQKMGYTNVASMAGGWREWQARGLPIEKV